MMKMIYTDVVDLPDLFRGAGCPQLFLDAFMEPAHPAQKL